MTNMNRMTFEHITDLAETMIELYDACETECPMISVFAKYDIAKSLLEELIMHEVPISFVIELEDPEIGWYDKEYSVTLEEGGVVVEKCYYEESHGGNGGYLYSKDAIALIHDECNSAILKYIDADEVYDWDFDVDEMDICPDCECDCCCERCLEEDDEYYEVLSMADNSDEPNGFTQSWSNDGAYYSRSFYSTDKALVQQMLQEWKI